MTEHRMAVIFDVDGPLLDLTPPETRAFFVPFAQEYGLTDLSEDWDSYHIRNDVEIYREILTDHARVSDVEAELERLSQMYFSLLETMFASGEAAVSAIPGAAGLLDALTGIDGLALGTATANFGPAARLRLERAGLWTPLRHYHFGAEGGGAKRDILARTLDSLNLPGERAVFLGDNLNDLDAARANDCHFIGFDLNPDKRARLFAAGASIVTNNHVQSLELIREICA